MSASPPEQEPPFVRAWHQRQPGQLIGKGHPAGDFLEAYRWTVLEERPGLLRVREIDVARRRCERSASVSVRSALTAL